MQSTAAHLCSTRGSFCGAVLGQLAQILSQQCSASSLSHAVDRGLPVLHTREFLQSGPWAVSSHSQPTVLGQYLVKCRRPWLACAPHEGDFLNSLEEDHLPIYSVVTFWQGEYTHNELFGKPCFGEFLWSCPWAVSSNSQSQRSPTPLSHAVDHGLPVLHAPLGSASQGFAHILRRTASFIPLSCHMRENNQTNHSLSSHSPPNQTPCSPSNFFPQKLFKKVCFTSLTFPAQSIEQWCHCYFPVHNSTFPSHPCPQKKINLKKK